MQHSSKDSLQKVLKLAWRLHASHCSQQGCLSSGQAPQMYAMAACSKIRSWRHSACRWFRPNWAAPICTARQPAAHAQGSTASCDCSQRQQDGRATCRAWQAAAHAQAKQGTASRKCSQRGKIAASGAHAGRGRLQDIYMLAPHTRVMAACGRCSGEDRRRMCK